MDTFVEYMVKKKKGTKEILKIFLSVTGAILLSIIIGFLVTITNKIFFIAWFAVVVAVWYGVYVIISRQNIEYEYSFTNGELDVDSIYSKRRRVHLLTLRVREFDICAPAFDERFRDAYINAGDIKKLYQTASSIESDRLYFADFLLNGDKVRLLFEPSDKMIEAIKRFNVRNVYLKEEAN